MESAMISTAEENAFNSPAKKSKVIVVPEVSLKLFDRKDLKLQLDDYLCDLGKCCYVFKSVGNMITYCCKGKQEGLCPFFVKCKLSKVKGVSFWHISDVNLLHTSCLFAEKRPSLKMLKDDPDLVSVAGKATCIEDVVKHAHSSNQITLSVKMGSRLMLHAKNKVSKRFVK
jgi:hypothetical protein